jgi:hypothetical protein
MATKTKKQTVDLSQKIISAYMDHVLTENKQPVSVYAFALKAGITEKEFYNYFASFTDIDQKIWDQAGEQTISTLASSKEFETYTSREKILGFFYTLQEVLNNQRSYFIYSLKANKPMFRNLKGFRLRIEDFSKQVIQQGISDKELEERKLISDRYHDGVWANTLFILNFWAKDDSPGFEKTDAAIEKSVNLMLELMGKSALDSMLDLGKFLFQNATMKRG